MFSDIVPSFKKCLMCHPFFLKNLADMVHVSPCADCPYGKRIHVLPLDDTIEGITGKLVDFYLEVMFRRMNGTKTRCCKFLYAWNLWGRQPF